MSGVTPEINKTARSGGFCGILNIGHFVLKCLMFLYSIVLSARKRLLAVAIIRPETVWALDTREQMQREIALAHLRLGLPDQFHQ